MNNFASNLLDLSSENPNIDNKGPIKISSLVLMFIKIKLFYYQILRVY